MANYGCNLENIKIAQNKAKSKKDGFYTVRGMGYRVEGCRVTHVSDNRAIFEIAGGFLIDVGSLPDNSSKSKGQLMKEAFKTKGH
jgi:hypothetical protein